MESNETSEESTLAFVVRSITRVSNALDAETAEYAARSNVGNQLPQHFHCRKRRNFVIELRVYVHRRPRRTRASWTERVGHHALQIFRQCGAPYVLPLLLFVFPVLAHGFRQPTYA